jgi:hypothetical protein
MFIRVSVVGIYKGGTKEKKTTVALPDLYPRAFGAARNETT